MSAMLTFTAHSQPNGYSYQILDQIWRDAWGSPLSWDLLPSFSDGYDILNYGTYRNLATGDTIGCRGHVDGSHTFTLKQVEK